MAFSLVLWAPEAFAKKRTWKVRVQPVLLDKSKKKILSDGNETDSSVENVYKGFLKERFIREVLRAEPQEVFTSFDLVNQHFYVVSRDGKIHVSDDYGVHFHKNRFGEVEWMPSFASAPRSALNIVLGTSVVIPGRTAAADLIRRPPPTRTEPPWYYPGNFNNVFEGIKSYGRVGRGLYLGLGNNIFFKHSPSQLFQFDQETGYEFLEGGTADRNPAFWFSPWIAGLPRADFWFSRGDARVNPFEGVGTARHFYRSLLFNPAKKHGAGKILLDPFHENRSYILTSQGVFRSDDNGVTYYSVFSAAQQECCVEGGFSEEGVLYIFGKGSFYESSDGNNFISIGELTSGSVLEKWIAADGRSFFELPRTVRSLSENKYSKSNVDDNDDSYGIDSYLFLKKYVGLSQVKSMAEALGKDSVSDVLFATDKGLRLLDVKNRNRWKKIGGPFVAQQKIDAFLRDPAEPLHVLVALKNVLFESWNGGKSFDESLKMRLPILELRADLEQKNSFFILTARQVLKVGDQKPIQDKEQVLRLKKALYEEPPLHLMLKAARKNLVPVVPERIFSQDFFPKVKIVGGGIFSTSAARLNATFISAATSGGDRGDLSVGIGLDVEPSIVRDRQSWQGFMGFNLSWDLPSLMMPSTLPRRIREAKKTYHVVQNKVSTIYRTRHALMRELAFSGSGDEKKQMELSLRIDELTAKLNILTGYFEDAQTFASDEFYQSIINEDSLAALLKETAEHFFVDEERQKSRKTRASLKGALPVVQMAGGIWGTYMDEPVYNLELLSENSPWIKRNAESILVDINVILAWDLQRLIFDTQELDVVRLSHIRRLIQEEVIELYFQNRRLELELRSTHRHTLETRLFLELEIEELTKRMNALCGKLSDEESQSSKKESADLPETAASSFILPSLKTVFSF